MYLIPGSLTWGAHAALSMEGKVTGVGGTQIKIQLYKESNLKRGDRLSVIRYVDDFFHPITGALLEQQIEVIAKAHISSIDRQSCLARVSGRRTIVNVGDIARKGDFGPRGTKLWVPPLGRTTFREQFDDDLSAWSRYAGQWTIEGGVLNARVAENREYRYAHIMSKTLFGPYVSIRFSYKISELGSDGRLVFSLYDPSAKEDHYWFTIHQRGVGAHKNMKRDNKTEGYRLVENNFVYLIDDDVFHTVTVLRTVWYVSVLIDNVEMFNFLDMNYPRGQTQLGLLPFDCKASFDNVSVISYPKVVPPDPESLLDGGGKILDVSGEYIWVHYGKQLVNEGDRYPVARRAEVTNSKGNRPLFVRYEKIGVIEIVKVGLTVSKARIMAGDGISIGDTVRLEKPSTRTDSWLIKSQDDPR